MFHLLTFISWRDRHKLSPCAKDVISGTLDHAVEDGAEMLKLMVSGLTLHLDAGQLGQHNVATKVTSIGESPY